VQNDFEISQSDAFATPGFYLALADSSVQLRHPGLKDIMTALQSAMGMHRSVQMRALC